MADEPKGFDPSVLGTEAGFGAFMDWMGDDTNEAPATAGATEEPAAGATTGSGTAEEQGAGAEAPAAGAPDAGAGGEQAVQDTGQPAGTPAEPTAAGAGAVAQPPAPKPTNSPAVTETLGKVQVAIVENFTKVFQDEEVTAMRTEFKPYFDAIDVHPRLLVGKQVPSLDPEKEFEILRDASDAREWQDATKQLLAQEARARVSRRAEEERDTLAVIQNTTEFLQKNQDLLRNKPLADQFAKLAKPYEYKVDGNLVGWSINVAPLLDSLRAMQAAQPAQAAATAPAKPAVAPAPPKPAHVPQGGVQSKAGEQAEDDSFDTFWGTLGFTPGTIRL